MAALVMAVLALALLLCGGAEASASPAAPFAPPAPEPSSAASPGAWVPGPTQAPWIEAPGGAPGAPVNPAPTHPPAGSIPAPGQCNGKQKFVYNPMSPFPDTWCQLGPHKWVRDPSSLLPPSNTVMDLDPDHCDAIDLGCKAGEAVTGWFKRLVESARKPVFAFLTVTILGTPELNSPQMQRPREIWSTSQTIANTVFVLLVTAAGVLLVTGQALPGEHEPKQVLPRLVTAFLAANLSLIAIKYAIGFANGLAAAFLHAGGAKIDPKEAGKTLTGGIEASLATGGTFLVLVALVAVILALIVAFIYVSRLAITMVLIAAAPLALICHALPATGGIARLWWRAMAGMLAIQVCQALVLITALQVLFASSKNNDPFLGVPTAKADAIDILLVIALLLVMIKIPGWVARSIWGAAQPGLLGQMAKTFILYRGVGMAMNKLGNLARAGRTAKTAQALNDEQHLPPASPRPRPNRLALTPSRSPALTSPHAPPALPPGPDVPPENPRTFPMPPGPRPGALPLPARTSGPPALMPPPTRPTLPAPPPPPEPRPGPGGQLALPLGLSETPPVRRPAQLTLPVDAPRVPRPPLPPEPKARARVRSRQLQFPAMPKRPVPHRQLTLRVQPPKPPPVPKPTAEPSAPPAKPAKPVKAPGPSRTNRPRRKP
ncbi:hypothetical protein [Actinomadura parmotrematis]|uniref:TrbL/VirB6 plasmid conjugal transfer protein n=1 Tax=Actinomadura parmotrematis TaxID=2864039 RepID=A0ABS7G3L1_9ACTN|nr:hypothetical protein [Actinomadura parmotrematis]MBW8487289.1 hypothetical protein [Actinomadura parmotrematis]